MIVHNLFPTPVAFFDLPRELAKKELAYLTALPRRPNQGNETSEDNYLLDSPKLADLAAMVVDCVDRYATEVWRAKDAKVRVTQSWMNYTKPGQWHHKHAHPNSLFSGVLYVKTDESRDKIFFHQDGYRQIKPAYSEWNLYNSESWWLPVKSNSVVLFPSWFTHSVETVQDGPERMSLAFNTFPAERVGDNQNLTELIVKGGVL